MWFSITNTSYKAEKILTVFIVKLKPTKIILLLYCRWVLQKKTGTIAESISIHPPEYPSFAPYPAEIPLCILSVTVLYRLKWKFADFLPLKRLGNAEVWLDFWGIFVGKIDGFH